MLLDFKTASEVYYCMLITRKKKKHNSKTNFRKLSHELMLDSFFHVTLEDLHVSCTDLIFPFLLLLHSG